MSKSLKSILAVVLILAVVALPASAAVSTSCPHTNATPGVGAVVKEDVFQMDAVAKYPVGTRKSLADGRMYRYAHFGADTSAGLLVAQDISESSSLSTSGAFTVVASASAQTTTDGLINSKYVEITASGVTANQYAGGYLSVNDLTGKGYLYRIKSNTATDDPASGNFRVQLIDELQVALVATSQISIIGDMYANLEGATAATDMFVVGSTVSAMDVSEAAYGWIQTKGPSSVLIDGTIAAGDVVTLSDGVTGAVQLQDAYTEQIVGYCIDPGQSTSYGVIFLQMD